MVIYRLTCRVSGRVYIGKTVKPAEHRWNQHIADAADGLDLFLHRAIRKHGSKAFSLDVLYTAKTVEELNAMETFFIVLHQSHRPENGYNMTLGGDGGITPGGGAPKGNKNALGFRHTPEERIAMSIRRKGNTYASGHKITEATRRQMRQSHLGKQQSLETRRSISQGVRRSLGN